MKGRITERQLILPALWCMSQQPNGEISTTDLIAGIRPFLKPTGRDSEKIAGRNDDHFSQKVRNLKSHNSLERLGLAKYGAGVWRITEKGREFVQENIDFLSYLQENDFQSEDVSGALESVQLPSDAVRSKRLLFDENVTVREGGRSPTAGEKVRRSVMLRNAAMKAFTIKGRLPCRACGFDFEQCYGELGSGYIEIHHQKPVFAYEEDDLAMTIKTALANLIPLCANCHRMVHRRKGKTLSLKQLKATIQP